MPSVDEVLRHAFEHADDGWGRLAPVARSAVVARHRRHQLVQRGVAAGVVTVAATLVVVLSSGDVRDSRGIEPAEQTPTATGSPLATPLEGRWVSGPLGVADVRAAARAAGMPQSADIMLADLPRTPFRVVVAVRGASLSTYVEGPGGRRELLDQESISVDGSLATLSPFDMVAGTVHAWAISGDTLTMDFRSTTEGETDGIPGESWQRLLYDAGAFTR